MNRLAGYLLTSLTRGYVIALVAIGALFWLMELLQRLEDLEISGIRLLDVATSALVTVPGSLVILAPVIVVMATAGVMGSLQNQRELVVLRASGVSLARLTRLALVPALLLGIGALAVSQWYTPLLKSPMAHSGLDEVGEAGLMDESHGLWSRKSMEFLNVREFELGWLPRDVRIFRFDDRGRLQQHIRAARADIRADSRWLLEDVVIQRFDGTEPRREVRDTWLWDSFLSGADLELLRQPPAHLALSDLYLYVQGLRMRQEEALEFELYLWRRLTIPLACLAMVLVAMGSATGSSRTQSLSLRISIAMGIGISYQLITELVGYTGLLMRADPRLVALGPPLALVMLGSVLLYRQR